MKPPAEYWVTVGTTLPILALALVVEARSLVSTWTLRTPRALRAVQTLLWLLPLVAATVSEVEVLRMLRVPTGSSWAWRLCDGTIIFSFSVLVISPAIDLAVRGYAEFIARIIAARPFQLTKIRRAGRSMEKEQRAGRRERQKLERERPPLIAMLDGIEAKIDKAEADGVPAKKVHQMRDQLADQRASIGQQFAAADARWDDVEAQGAQVRAAYAEGRETVRARLAELRGLWTDVLIQGGVGGQPGLQQQTTTPGAGQGGESGRNDGDVPS